jgi:hypothetical protein
MFVSSAKCLFGRAWSSAKYNSYIYILRTMAIGPSLLKKDGHRVARVLSFFSSRRNFDSLTPSPVGECVCPPPPFGSGGGEVGRQ